MTELLAFKRPTHRSWVKLVAVSSFSSLLPFGLFMGVFALFGFNTVQFNGEPLFGWIGLLGGFFGSIFLAGFITIFAASFGYLGIWLFSHFRNMELEYLPKADSDKNS
ncbi:hypothetical protein [Sulfuriferula sp. AH1]|uniref:hypothetical protein n=1 Tax=Sulfuriferula sp. AH1 TaxID=1985873 RepID=UPI0012F94189|nr:hypothetical protein [Sulfuriferula sp. AH1]